MRNPGPNVKVGVPMFVSVFVVAAVLLFAGASLVKPASTTAADAGGGPPPTGPVSVTVTAKNLTFDQKNIVAGAGSPVTVTLDNEDAGVLHNIAFYTSKAATTKIAVGNVITGPATEDVKFAAPGAAGSYYFRCDVHPDTMNGNFIVK